MTPTIGTPRIQQLSSEVVDQIAAGEVVERPAHLVKELVENALDAGAQSIEIEYDQGGRRIRVTDDGSGIAAEDLKLALARHATSKIAKADDLWALESFGFRGEALASIAAVSRMSMTSRRADQATAHRITSEFGRLSGPDPVGGNLGTTVQIEDLFANVPARLKFMKSEAGEGAQIKAVVRGLALANEGVEFRLRSKNKLEAAWPKAADFLERAKQVLAAEKLYEAHMDYEGYKAHVVFAGPHEVAGTSRNILIFVQRRPVQDRGLQAAVMDAFRGLLMHGEFPIVAVRLLAPLDEVDVNIHPTKSQVKFRDNQPAFRAVNRALRAGIELAPWLERAAKAELPSETVAPASVTRKFSVAELTRRYDAGVPAADASEAPDLALSLASAPLQSVGRFEAPEFNAVVFRQKHDAIQPAALGAESASVANSPPAQEAKAPGAWSRLQVLGQAHLTYILAQDEGKLVLIDQHAAHERVAYEKLMRAWTGGDVKVQSLLLPLTVDVEADGAEALLSVADDLEKLGVMIDQLGPQSIAVRTKPVILSDAALGKALKELAREITDRGGSFVLEKKISDLCATMACHSVVRAGQALSIEQMKSLLVQMDEFALSSFCPHGRPVSVDYPFSKLERDFGRIT